MGTHCFEKWPFKVGNSSFILSSWKKRKDQVYILVRRTNILVLRKKYKGREAGYLLEICPPTCPLSCIPSYPSSNVWRSQTRLDFEVVRQFAASIPLVVGHIGELRYDFLGARLRG